MSKLALGNDSDGGQHDGGLAAALEAQGLACVPVPSEISLLLPTTQFPQ